MALDRTRHYGTSLGHIHVRFLQDGKLFNEQGEEIDEKGNRLDRGTVLSPAKTVVPVEAPTDKLQQIVDAIGLLDESNKNHFTGQGIPRVEALTEILGFEVTAADRNAAWERF